jgi:hypothetical protein
VNLPPLSPSNMLCIPSPGLPGPLAKSHASLSSVKAGPDAQPNCASLEKKMWDGRQPHNLPVSLKVSFQKPDLIKWSCLMLCCEDQIEYTVHLPSSVTGLRSICEFHSASIVNLQGLLLLPLTLCHSAPPRLPAPSE